MVQNNANQTNLYTVRGDGSAESYTALFAGAGFRYAQLSGIPEGWGEGDKAPAGWGGWKTVLTALRVHSDVQPSSDLQLPMTVGMTLGTEDVLSKIHHMTMASQVRRNSHSCRCRVLSASAAGQHPADDTVVACVCHRRATSGRFQLTVRERSGFSSPSWPR
eukprot:COSAG04_NODE_2216_length_4513_cov_3.037155_3_plen_162_part_00